MYWHQLSLVISGQRAVGGPAQLTCGVCYVRVDEDQEAGERIFKMPCTAGHVFHEACVTKWLLECKAACPTCHHPIGE